MRKGILGGAIVCAAATGSYLLTGRVVSFSLSDDFDGAQLEMARNKTSTLSNVVDGPGRRSFPERLTASYSAARPVVLPRIGSFDALILSTRDVALSVLREEIVGFFIQQVGKCSRLHRNGETTIEGRVEFSVNNGALTINGLGDLQVRAGAPISHETEKCIRSKFATSSIVAGPPPAPENPVQSSPRKWPIRDYHGDLVAATAYRDHCGKEMPRP